MRALLAIPCALLLLGAAPAPSEVQLLDIERGYLFTTHGESYRIEPNATVATIPPGTAVRLEFDAQGAVQSVTVLPKAKEKAADVAPVTFVVRVPASTAASDQVYLSTNQSSWNALAIRMDRVDPLHYRAVVSVPIGGPFRYLYTRGNSPTIERGANGRTRDPRVVLASDASARIVNDTVEHWGDEVGNTQLPAPQATPTPFNPAPFPNLPNAPPAAGRSAVH